eukprot:TRINITY_DN15770_c0_g1_i1.p1 TRINITY_DN15770_c0_g1~~TRINITY_DN15770_c0_g1_i1.p1  ORF type:complete len:425 (+),score=108.14 TRINITY_DN15770_c0_g1_i1:31-1305(+)
MEDSDQSTKRRRTSPSDLLSPGSADAPIPEPVKFSSDFASLPAADSAETDDAIDSTVDVVYVEDKDLITNFPLRINGKRDKYVDALIEAFGLKDRMNVKQAVEAKREDLLRFHSEEYVEALYTLDEDNECDLRHQAAEHGLIDDCPVFDQMLSHVLHTVGGSLTAAQALLDGARVAIWWAGGRHHAHRDEAAGYCYANDIVLSVMRLLQCMTRVMYVDIDVHHGDGVEEAFASSNKVYTISFHKHQRGFFPGSGAAHEIGVGQGKNYSLNVPLGDGISDIAYVPLFREVVSAAVAAFRPQAIVLQCGCDALAADPLGVFGLTANGFADCVEHVLAFKLPTLLLGGGGYEQTMAARCWAVLTSVAVGRRLNLSTDIPDHKYWHKYGPMYRLACDQKNIKDTNTTERIQEIKATALAAIARIAKPN